MTGDIWHNPEVVTCDDCPVPLETIVVGMLGIKIAEHCDEAEPLIEATAQALSDSVNNVTPNNVSERLQSLRDELFEKAALLGGATLHFDEDTIAQFRIIAGTAEYCDQVGRSYYQSGCSKFETLLQLLSNFTEK